jgi:tetratricopeptide (TPR) repeat protein
LIEVLYGLARGLETQITLLERPEDRQVLSEGLGAFLEQVRGESSDLRILNWVAESFASLGRGLGDDPRSAEARRACFARAIETYEQILNPPGAEPLAPEMRRGLQLRLALAQRSGGQFDDAIATFRQMLADDGRKVDVQVEAALTYQLWAAEPQQAPKYKLAVGGGEPDAATHKNLIWGWNRIAQIVSRYEEYREVYHQARFNAAQCHYKYALRLRTPADRQKYLKSAKDYIVFTQRLYPQMGGAQWRAKYDTLLKSIQRGLSESPVGLAKTGAGS